MIHRGKQLMCSIPVASALVTAVWIIMFVFGQPHGRDASAMFYFERAAIPCEVRRGQPLTSEDILNTFAGDSEACNRLPLPSLPAPEPLFPKKNVYLSVVSSALIHDRLHHLAGNLLGLWLLSAPLERRKGSFVYLAIFVLSQFVSVAIYATLRPNVTTPFIGASAAIFGLQGALLILYPRSRMFAFGRFPGVEAAVVLVPLLPVALYNDLTHTRNVLELHIAGWGFGLGAGVFLRLVQRK